MGIFGRDKTAERLGQLEGFVETEWTPGPADMEARAERLETTREQMTRRLDNALARRGVAGSVRAQLRKADLKLTVVEYLALHVALAAVLGGLGFALRGVVGGGLPPSGRSL